MIFSNNTQKTGQHFENVAASFLKKEGLRLVESNYRCRAGEIDLVMLDGEMLVFVEVRHRHSKNYGGAAASVTFAKQRKLTKTALCYLTHKGLYEKKPCRFDVLAIQGEDQVEWIKNAF